MRDFYRAYEDTPSLLDAAMQVGWTQNVVILEADLSNEQREWYLRAAKQFGWSKAELIEKIKDNAYEAFVLIDVMKKSAVLRRKQLIKRIPIAPMQWRKSYGL